MKIAVLDIGGTSIKSGIYEAGALSGVKETPTHAERGGEAVMRTALGVLRDYAPFDAVGVSTAGQVDPEQGMIRYANSNIPGYTGMRIREILEREFGVPAAVENDVNAAALAEGVFGAGAGERDFLCLTYGTGVGGAVIEDGKLWRGSAFSAGEFGGMVVHGEDRDVRKDMFSGCYERYASVTALVRQAQALDRQLDSGRKIFARLDEAEVQELVDRWIGEVVWGLVSLIHIFNPSCIVLGGGIMEQPYILEKVRKTLYENIMPGFRNVEILQARLGNTAGLLGAAKAAEERWEKAAARKTE